MRKFILLFLACASFPATAVFGEREVLCHDVLIGPQVIAMAWDDKDRLVPVLNSTNAVIESHINNQTGTWDFVRTSVVIPLRLTYDTTGSVFAPTLKWVSSPISKILRAGGRFETSFDASGPYALWMLAPPEGSYRRGRTGILLFNGRPVLARDPKSGAE